MAQGQAQRSDNCLVTGFLKRPAGSRTPWCVWSQDGHSESNMLSLTSTLVHFYLRLVAKMNWDLQKMLKTQKKKKKDVLQLVQNKKMEGRGDLLCADKCCLQKGVHRAAWPLFSCLSFHQRGLCHIQAVRHCHEQVDACEMLVRSSGLVLISLSSNVS